MSTQRTERRRTERAEARRARHGGDKYFTRKEAARMHAYLNQSAADWQKRWEDACAYYGEDPTDHTAQCLLDRAQCLRGA